MAVNPVSQPLSPGLLEVDYSPWDAAAAARSGAPGGLLGSPAIAPLSAPSWTGGTRYGNYVRYYPDLMTNFMAPTNPYPNIQDYGKWHYTTHGIGEGRTLPTANPNVSLGDIMDTAPGALGYGSSGLPMPDVEGYKYVYPKWEWNSSSGYYESRGHEEDIDKYQYYPYYPGDPSARLYDDKGAMMNNILVGLKLIKK
jgi:hypothetical protein